MTLELLRDPKSKRRWPAPGSAVLFEHLNPRRSYCHADDTGFDELVTAHGWVLIERPASEDEQIDFCHRTGAANYSYVECRMLWRPVGV